LSGAHHHHSIPSTQNERALIFAFLFTFSFLIIEFITGLYLNSLALLADAAHMFTDAAALAVALAALRIARLPADYRRTFGYYRFEILAATFNAILLFLVAMYIVYEAYERFHSPTEVKSTGMMAVACIGLIINFISVKLLSAGKDSNLNLKGAYLEVWSDLLGSAGVLFGALLIYFTGWIWVDSFVALGIGLWVLPRTWLLLKESLNILLEGVPEGVSVDEVCKTIANLPGVISVHDLHIWALTSGKNNLTAHVVYNEQIDPDPLIQTIQETLEKNFHVYHTTIQAERTPCNHCENGCRFHEK
jgi:cobalt-zinc-cadmium efflux system protein